MTDASTICANCGRPRAERFCPRCGQNDRTYSRSLFPVLGELIRESFEFDGRLAQTLKLLLFKPGSLSTEFSRNRRASYMTPVRLYLFTSIVCFLTMSMTMSFGGQFSTDPDEPFGEPFSAAMDSVRALEPRLQVQINGDSVPLVGQDIELSPARVAAFKAFLEPAQQSKLDDILARDDDDLTRFFAAAFVQGRDGLIEEAPTPAGVDPLVGAAVEQAGEAADDESTGAADPQSQAETGTEAVEASGGGSGPMGFLQRMFWNSTVDMLHDVNSFRERLVGNLSVAMFCLLPVYALLLAALYLRQRRFYIEHLVFGMHLHSFLFLVATLMMLVATLPLGGAWQGWIEGLLGLVFVTYPVIAMRRFYRNGWFMTLFKAVVLAGLYLVVLVPITMFALFLTA